MTNTDTTALGRLDHGEHQAILSAPATRYRRFVVTLSSSVHGELDRHQAPTRAAALELARTMVDDAIAQERERQWLHGETVVIKIEQDDG
jgi:hypothetical protein